MTLFKWCIDKDIIFLGLDFKEIDCKEGVTEIVKVKQEEKTLEKILKAYQVENKLNNGELKEQLLYMCTKIKVYKRKWTYKNNPEKKSLEKILKEHQVENKLNHGELREQLLYIYKKLKFYKHKGINNTDPEMWWLDKYLSYLTKSIRLPLKVRICLNVYWEKISNSPSCLLLFAFFFSVIPIIIFGLVITFFIVNLFDNNGELICIPWIFTFITGFVAIVLRDRIWARLTIILFSISVGMFTAYLFDQKSEVTLDIIGEDIVWTDAMIGDELAVLELIDDLKIQGEIDNDPLPVNIENLLVNQDTRHTEEVKFFTLNTSGDLSDGDSTGLEIRVIQNNMQTSDIVSLSLAIAAVLITIFEVIISRYKKRKVPK